MKIYSYHHEVPNTAIFVRSEATGQIYAMDSLPEFGGFTVVTKADYDNYVKTHHLR